MAEKQITAELLGPVRVVSADDARKCFSAYPDVVETCVALLADSAIAVVVSPATGLRPSCNGFEIRVERPPPMPVLNDEIVLFAKGGSMECHKCGGPIDREWPYIGVIDDELKPECRTCYHDRTMSNSTLQWSLRHYTGDEICNSSEHLKALLRLAVRRLDATEKGSDG